MTNHRTKVREALALMLKGQTIAGDKIFTNRARPIVEADMPAVLIYTAGSSRRPDKDTHDGSMLARQMEVVIEAALAGSGHAETLETDLEEFADQVETVVEGDTSISLTAEDAAWQESQIDIVSDGRKLIGVVRIVYLVFVYSHHDANASWLETGVSSTPSILGIIDPDGPTPYSVHSPAFTLAPAPPAVDPSSRPFVHGTDQDE